MERKTALALARVAAAEAERAKDQLRVPGFPRVYFLSYLLRDEERWRVRAKFGGLRTSHHDRGRSAFCDVRVGSRRFDQIRDGGLLDNDKEMESYDYVDLPFDGDPAAVRHGLWRLTDARYREAVESYLDRRGRELTYQDPGRRFVALDRREPVTEVVFRRWPKVDVAHWERYAERTSAMIRRYPEIKDSHVEFEAEHLCRVFVSTEGARIVEASVYCSVECYLWMLSDKGDAFPWTIKHSVRDPAELPTEAELRAEIRTAIGKLRRLAAAPTLRAFCGPALLEPVPAGLLMHEAVGHRLEGSRLLATGEGQTFRDSIGRKILPPFLSMSDNPSLARFQGKSLVGALPLRRRGRPGAGHAAGGRRASSSVSSAAAGGSARATARRGMPAAPTTSGRSPGWASRSSRPRTGWTIARCGNGSSRRSGGRRPPSVSGSSNASSGETATEAYNFQAFLGEVNMAAKVYPDGSEELIRGVNLRRYAAERDPQHRRRRKETRGRQRLLRSGVGVRARLDDQPGVDRLGARAAEQGRYALQPLHLPHPLGYTEVEQRSTIVERGPVSRQAGAPDRPDSRIRALARSSR